MSKKRKKKDRNNTDVTTADANSARREDSKAKQKLGNKGYEAELFKLQVELVKLQEWVKKTGACIVILFEGRDAARAASSSAFWNG